MKRSKNSILIFSNCFLLFSCGLTSSLTQSNSNNGHTSASESSIDETQNTTSDEESVNRSDDEESYLETQDSFKFLFDDSKPLYMNLEISDEALNFISTYQSNRGIYSDAYLPAKLTIDYDGKTYVYDEVGIRQKGNLSRTSFFDGSSITNPVHFKLSFKATFDDDIYDQGPLAEFKKEWNDQNSLKKRKSRDFLGYQKLDLKYVPRNNGQCLGREIYAYRAFEEAGLIAPKSRICNLRFGNTHFFESAYQVVETIDKDFLTRRFKGSDSKGDLYKCVYNGMGKADFSRSDAVEKTLDENGHNVGARIENGKIGVEDPFLQYFPIYQLKTNKLGENSDFSSMSNFINTLWNVVYGNDSQESLESLLDTSQFLKFSAISYLLGNFDDQRYNNNNFYIYFIPSTSKAIFIPYDWDWCLGAGDMNDSKLYHSEPFDNWTLDGGEPNSLFKATFLPSSSLSYDASAYRDEYAGYIREFKDAVLDCSNFESFLERLDISNDELTQVRRFMVAKLNVLRTF